MAIRFLVKQFQTITKPLLPVVWIPLVYTILSSLALILNFWTTGDMLQDEQFHKEPACPETFDFIVVGAGSAGSVVANRLSKKYRVLLLEAGGEPNPLQYIPGFGVFFVNYPETDWMHKTVPQKYGSLNSVNQQSSWSAGKTLGGTGTLNLMIHLRGHKKDFDNWGRLLGDPSWSWEGVLPFFKSYEDYEEGGDSAIHGSGGPLRVETPDYIGMGPEFVRAGQELGYSQCDLNGPFNEGFDIIRYPINNGIRQGTYKAFLEPIRRLRKNLVIRKFAHVNRVLFRGNWAYGVEYDRQGATRQAFASKEVILSAGTVNTAKLLLLSGIGPRSHLQEHGIPVIQDLPVGLNLQDHIAAYVGPFFIDKPRAVMMERDLTPGAFVQWFLGGNGVLSTTGCHATGCISSSLAKARGEWDWPDIQYFLFGFSVFKNFANVFSHSFGLTLDEQRKFWEHAIDKESFLVAVSGARPYSRGFVKLGGKSPYDAPIIDPRYFSDPGDQDLLSIVEGIKILLLLAENTTALGWELGTKYTTQKLPGCEHLNFKSDEYWECYVRRYTVTLHHPVGTASMGSVVDTHLKVYGVQNLRVMDASVEPVLVVTNTQASAIMIGEKGSDMVLRHWQEKEEQEKLAKTQYGPPKNQYGAPQNQYGAPQPEYGIPPTTCEEPKPSPNPPSKYGAPNPPNKYGAPNPPSQYGAPNPPSQYGAPNPPSQYGAPNPPSQYGAPNPTSQYEAPNPTSQYGAPNPPSQYGAPNPPSQYEAPNPTSQYGAPNPPPNTYSAPQPPTSYGTPNPPNSNGKLNPPNSYGIPSPSTQYGTPPPLEYGSPQTDFGTPAQKSTLPVVATVIQYNNSLAQYGEPTPPPLVQYAAPQPSLLQQSPVLSIYETPPKELFASTWNQQKRSALPDSLRNVSLPNSFNLLQEVI